MRQPQTYESSSRIRNQWHYMQKMSVSISLSNPLIISKMIKIKTANTPNTNKDMRLDQFISNNSRQCQSADAKLLQQSGSKGKLMEEYEHQHELKIKAEQFISKIRQEKQRYDGNALFMKQQAENRKIQKCKRQQLQLLQEFEQERQKKRLSLEYKIKQANFKALKRQEERIKREKRYLSFGKEQKVEPIDIIPPAQAKKYKFHPILKLSNKSKLNKPNQLDPIPQICAKKQFLNKERCQQKSISVQPYSNRKPMFFKSVKDESIDKPVKIHSNIAKYIFLNLQDEKRLDEIHRKLLQLDKISLTQSQNIPEPKRRLKTLV